MVKVEPFCSSDVSDVERPADFEFIEENEYLQPKRKRSKSKQRANRMLCDCVIAAEDLGRGLLGCTEDCLNRLLMIECSLKCETGSACSNKRFQNKEWIKVEVFKTENKGWGLRALEEAKAGMFVIEYVGEVLNRNAFEQRVVQYAEAKNKNYYFMSLKSNEIIDATLKGNFARYVNHSCSPNCETEKWTVKGELRVGFFAKQDIDIGEELTIDYKFQRYGKELQKCFCESANCTGYIGGVEIPENFNFGGQLGKEKQIVERDDKKHVELLEDQDFNDADVDKLCNSGGLNSKEETLALARLMFQAEEVSLRLRLLDVILKTNDAAYLKLIIDYHALSVIWSWMVDCKDLTLKFRILEVLAALPVPNKTVLLDSKVINVVQKWSEANKIEKKDLKSEEGKDDSNIETTENTDATESTEPCEPFIINEDAIKKEVGVDQPVSDENETELLKAEELSEMASVLLQSWSTLKEVFRIPRLPQQAGLFSGQSLTKFDLVKKISDNSQDCKKAKVPRPAKKYVCRSKTHSFTFPRLSKENRRHLFAMEMKKQDEAQKLKENTDYSFLNETFFTGQSYFENYSVNQSPVVPFGTAMNPAYLPPAVSPMPMPGELQPLPLPNQNMWPYMPYSSVGVPWMDSSVVPFGTAMNPAYLPPAVSPMPMPGDSSVPAVPQNFPAPYGVVEDSPSSTCTSAQSSSSDMSDVASSVPYLAAENPLWLLFARNNLSIEVLERLCAPPVVLNLPLHWKAATDHEGSIYYYHSITRKSQWEPPDPDEEVDEPQLEKESIMDTTKDCVIRKIKELFRIKLSMFVVQYLSKYQKSDCRVGKIVNVKDFKYLARKLTHAIMTKELRRCKDITTLEYNDIVKCKAKEFIQKYMNKFGLIYRRVAL